MTNYHHRNINEDIFDSEESSRSHTPSEAENLNTISPEQDNVDPFLHNREATDNEEIPINFESPVIQLKKNENITLNNLNNPNKPNKKYPKSKIANSTNPANKTESKNHHKGRKSSFVQLKNKFAPETLDFISGELKDYIFSGWVGEREYVERLKAYRDIIDIDEWEEKLILKLKTVMQCIPGVMTGTKWINISAPSKVSHCYCLWVLLDSVPYPGHYWFQITDVSSDPEFGLKFSVKILREIHPFDGETKTERDKRLRGDFTLDDWKKWFFSGASTNFEAFGVSILSSLTFSNLTQAFRLIVILSVTLVVAVGNFFKYVLEFIPVLLHSLGMFVHYTTPLSQTIVGLFEKVIGGFYLLIAMVYKDLRHPRYPPPPPPPPPQSAILFNHRAGGDYSPPKPLKYVPSQSWVYKDTESTN